MIFLDIAAYVDQFRSIKKQNDCLKKSFIIHMIKYMSLKDDTICL